MVDSNALETLVPCLEEFDPTVKEAASWAIGYIAQHTPGTATYHLYPVILTMALIDVGARVICACIVEICGGGVLQPMKRMKKGENHHHLRDI